ncbi:MAG TPA: hypothetical protein VFR33_07765 [Candidatus Dormibacteraeota bacterium]|nr:hypothetical protein [Candidatus Dormibacteraeota bacterium]
MPETEPKPKLIELVAPGGAQGWKAVLKSGKPAVVHEIQVAQAEAVAAAPRLQRLYEHRHPALSAVLAWGTDANGVWVAVEPNEGTPLSSILSRGPLTPPAAATLGAAVLSGVAALHEAGIAMGGFGATAVRVTSNGEVRLAGHPAAAVRGAPSQSDLRADVRSCGMAVCAAFGVDPAGAPAPPNIPPGLVVTMRSMASGAMGPSADRAQAALREMAAALLAPDREVAAQSELATRAGGREVPAITPFLPPGTVVPESRSSQPVPSVAAVAPAAPAAPAPYIAPPPPRQETPVRQSVSYDAPDRPLQTYPSMPAVTFPPVPAPPPPLEPPVAPSRPAPAVPTWSEAPAASAAPVEAPKAEPEAPKPVVPPAPTWDEPAAPEPAAPVAPAVPITPVAPAFATSPPAPVSAPAPPPPAEPTWTPMEQPVWRPGDAVPAEPLGTGVAVAEAVRTPTPPPPSRTPTVPPPVRRPTVPRPPVSAGVGILAERPPWLIPAAVAVIIVLVLGIVGIKLLTSRGTSGSPTAQVTASPSAHASGSPHATPSSTPSNKGPLAVPTTFGPASAEPVKSIQICTVAAPCNIPGASAETATACELSSCKIEVAMYFTAVQKSVPISYIVKLFDRCTGQTTDLPGAGTTTPSTGFIVAIPTDHLTVNIPSGVKSGALVAVAQTPAVAASAPLLIGSQNSCA